MTGQPKTEADLLDVIRNWARQADPEVLIGLFAQALKLDTRPADTDPDVIATWVANSREMRADTAGRLTMLMSTSEVNPLYRLIAATFIQDHARVFNGIAFVPVHHCARMAFDLALQGIMYAAEVEYPETVYKDSRFEKFARVRAWVMITIAQNPGIAGTQESTIAESLLTQWTRTA